MTAKEQHWWKDRQQVRKTALVAVVIAGGLLQYARTQTKHPPLVLRVWTWIYAALVLFAIFAVLAWAVYVVRDRLGRRRHQ